MIDFNKFIQQIRIYMLKDNEVKLNLYRINRIFTNYNLK